jgi:hypothetical protein
MKITVDYRKRTHLVVVILALAILPARAEDKAIHIEVSTAKVLKFDRTIRDVIPGDKDIADVSVEGARTLVVTGKKEGRTNVIVYDANSNEIYSADIIVGPRNIVWGVPKAAGSKTPEKLDSFSQWNCPPEKLCTFVKESETVLPTQVSRSSINSNSNINQNISGPTPSTPSASGEPLTQ